MGRHDLQGLLMSWAGTRAGKQLIEQEARRACSSGAKVGGRWAH